MVAPRCHETSLKKDDLREGYIHPVVGVAVTDSLID